MMLQINVILLGKVNTGKSTLFNRLVGSKLISTSGKPHTTKQLHIAPVRYNKQFTVNYIDSPGYDQLPTYKDLDVHIILLVSTLNSWNALDYNKLQDLFSRNKDIIIVFNKLDNYTRINQADLKQFKSLRLYCRDIICVSARHGHNIHLLVSKIAQISQVNAKYKTGQMQHNAAKISVHELLKEIIFRYFSHEIPHCVNIAVEVADLELNMIIKVAKQSHYDIINKKKNFIYNKVVNALKIYKCFNSKILYKLIIKHISSS